MNNNLTYKILQKEMQKKIINYLYKSKDISISEYEKLLSKCDEKIYKLKDEMNKNKDKYNYPVNVDIKI